MKAYLNWLRAFSKKYFVDVHAWVLMTNHVHLLCTPHEKGAISQMMQSIGRMYVRYYNDCLASITLSGLATIMMAG